jgi:hypothetical protein
MPASEVLFPVNPYLKKKEKLRNHCISFIVFDELM